MMKPRQILFVLLLCSISLRAASLDGTWGTREIAPDGNVTNRYFEFHQNGSELTGKIVMNFRTMPIKGGKMDGNHFSFFTEFGNPKSPVRVAWEGSIESDGLHVKVSPPNRPAVEAVATPVDAGLLAAPAKLPLPELKPVAYNHLSKTPPMGWNSWNKFQGKVDDKSVREVADAMVRNGMLDAGYHYVNIDDTWQGVRDARGRIQSNKKFPDMKALTDYVHSKGLLIGLYSSPGPKTCAGYEGSYGHELQDAEAYTDWGFDYLKYDWCSASAVYGDAEMHAAYQKMAEALAAQPRPVVYSLCQYGRADVWSWGPSVSGNLWRTTGDIRDAWESMSEIGFKQGELAGWAGPGHWNDPDMLEIGNGGMTEDEYRTHMSLWAMLAAPLLAGNDVRTMDKKTSAILLNKEVIAIDQDKAGKQGARLSRDGTKEIWTKPLEKGAVAVALFNRGDEPATISMKWADILKGHLNARNLWAHEFVKTNTDTWTVTVAKHGVVMLRVSAI